MRTIKRYSNRKLYDTQEKRYLTLNHLSYLVSKGEKVQVVDNDSGKDITGVVLSKALMGKEKDSVGGFLPAELLTNLLQGRPNQVIEYLRTSWETRLDQIKEIEGEIDKRFKGFLDKGKLTSSDAIKLRDSLLDGVRERWKDLEEGFESRLESAVESMPVASRRDVERIERQIEELGDIVASLGDKKSTKKKATKKTAKKAPAKRKAASKKAPAKRKAAPKKTAKKAPAKRKAAPKKAAKKAPAKRKAAPKKAAKKAPAKRKAAPKKTAKKAPAKRKAAPKKAAKKAPAKRKATPKKKAASKRARRS